MTSSTILLLEALARRPALVGALSLYACFYVAAGRAITRFFARCHSTTRLRMSRRSASVQIPENIWRSIASEQIVGHRRAAGGEDDGERGHEDFVFKNLN